MTTIYRFLFPQISNNRIANKQEVAPAIQARVLQNLELKDQTVCLVKSVLRIFPFLSALTGLVISVITTTTIKFALTSTSTHRVHLLTLAMRYFVPWVIDLMKRSGFVPLVLGTRQGLVASIVVFVAAGCMVRMNAPRTRLLRPSINCSETRCVQKCLNRILQSHPMFQLLLLGL